MTLVPKTKNYEEYYIPYCDKCKQDMEFKGGMGIGMYSGKLELYVCPTCRKTKVIEVKPTAEAEEKYKNFLACVDAKH